MEDLKSILREDPLFQEALDKNLMTASMFVDIGILCLKTFEEGRWREFIDVPKRVRRDRLRLAELEWWEAFIKFIIVKMNEAEKEPVSQNSRGPYKAKPIKSRKR